MQKHHKQIITQAFWGALGASFAIGIIYIFVKLINLWLCTFLALILSIFISFFVDFFQRRFKISRVISVVFTLFIMCLFIVLFILTLVPILLSQGQMALRQLPDLAIKVQNILNSYLIIEDILNQALELSGDVLSTSLSILSESIAVIVILTVIVVIAIYFSMHPIDDPKPFMRWLPETIHEKFSYLFVNIIRKIRAGLIGQLFSMSIIAIAYIIGLTIIGVPYALFFGILAGVLCFVPYLGPPLSTVGPLLFALVDSPIKALWVIVLYILSQVAESYFITPFIMKKQVRLHPIITILSIMAMGDLFGIIGIAVAVPITASLQFVAEETFLKKTSPQIENEKESKGLPKVKNSPHS
jgi:predicted PurR-regulated permease PerM